MAPRNCAGIFLIFQMFWEAVYYGALGQFKMLHPEEFASLDRCQSCVALMAKIAPQITQARSEQNLLFFCLKHLVQQVLWVFQLLLWGNLLLTYFNHVNVCVSRVSFSFFQHHLLLSAGTCEDDQQSATLSSNCLSDSLSNRYSIQTVRSPAALHDLQKLRTVPHVRRRQLDPTQVRLRVASRLCAKAQAAGFRRCPVRGELFTPADMDNNGFPLGLDCASCRVRARMVFCSGVELQLCLV